MTGNNATFSMKVLAAGLIAVVCITLALAVWTRDQLRASSVQVAMLTVMLESAYVQEYRTSECHLEPASAADVLTNAEKACLDGVRQRAKKEVEQIKKL